MAMKIPDRIKKELILKKDLSKEETHLYNVLVSKTNSNLMHDYLRSDETIQKQQGRVIASILYNRAYGFRDASVSISRKSELSKYVRFIKNKHIPDANKILILRRTIRGRIIPTNLLTDEVFLNDPELRKLLEDLVPEYGAVRALEEKDINKLIRVAENQKDTILRHTVTIQVFRTFPHQDTEKLLNAFPKHISGRFYFLSDKIRQGLSEDTIIKLVSANASIISRIPDNKLTDKVLDAALKRSGGILIDLPKKYWTKENVATAVKKSPSVLKYLSVEEQTPRLLMGAIISSSNSKKYIKKR